ncbi:LacI family DNA-binding transcriptional regulator [Geminisphaera colitermitum]|uniref:LacI family DNA-binding transcriptional regulator n=1 Tax=Geminisphaera colitermitum TaxID=1148786 RepID=UPI0005BDDC3E|nr:LacI family DNA-binding transcriptional regulator [Geminisphaera colitermitum]
MASSKKARPRSTSAKLPQTRRPRSAPPSPPNGATGKRPTIMDVAREAGVDYSTVSLALRKDPRIKTETRERIEAASKKIGYYPNRLARSLSGGATRVIGVMLTEMSRFFATPLEEFQRIGEAAGYTLSVHFSWWDMERERKGMQQFCENCVEGIIWAPNVFDTSLKETATLLHNARIPAVMLGLIHDDDAHTVPCHQIGIDIRNGLRLGLEYLLSLGHRRIAIATAAGMEGKRGDMFQLRLRILRELFAELGIPLADTDTFLATDHEHGGIEIAMQLASRPRTDWPTAIFAAEDSLARGLAKSLHAIGINIPRDISLLGYHVSSDELMGPVPLSTVSLESGNFATRAIDLLIGLMRKKTPSLPHQIITVPSTIIERESCARPR